MPYPLENKKFGIKKRIHEECTDRHRLKEEDIWTLVLGELKKDETFPEDNLEKYIEIELSATDPKAAQAIIEADLDTIYVVDELDEMGIKSRVRRLKEEDIWTLTHQVPKLEFKLLSVDPREKKGRQTDK